MVNNARLMELSDARLPGLAAEVPSPRRTARRRSPAPSISCCATHPVCGARTSLAWLSKSRGSGARALDGGPWGPFALSWGSGAPARA